MINSGMSVAQIKGVSKERYWACISTALWWGVWETYTNQTTLTSYLDNVVLSAGGAFKSSVITGGFDTIITTDKPAYQWYQENLYILNKGFLYDPP